VDELNRGNMISGDATRQQDEMTLLLQRSHSLPGHRDFVLVARDASVVARFTEGACVNWSVWAEFSGRIGLSVGRGLPSPVEVEYGERKIVGSVVADGDKTAISACKAVVLR